ncbi:LysR family transcriptional regulator [Turicimonas muris]|nr:LysR family transcriptional regulator [Turicimonas muris]
MFDIRALKFFIAVAEERNFTRAADRLFTTQPNVSHRLTSLEKSVGKQLIVRQGKHIDLTEEGQFLYSKAREIINLHQRTLDALKKNAEDIAGDVRIGAAETNAMHLIGEAVVKFRKKYPGIRVNFFSGSTKEIEEMLDNGLIDSALLVESFSLQRYDFVRLPVCDHFGVLMPISHKLSEKKSVTSSDLRHEPLMISEQALQGNVLSAWFGCDINSLNITSIFNLPTTPAMLVSSGLGLAFTFDKLINTQGTKICFRPLEPPLEANLYFVWKKNQVFSKAVQLFLNHFREFLFDFSKVRNK